MALVVEDATGLVDAESYISVDDFKAYHKDRGNDITLGGGDIEKLLRNATEYLDIRWGDYTKGNPINEDQALAYPTDYWITDPVSLPTPLVRATAEYAFYLITNPLYINNDGGNGPGITRLFEKVGPIETDTEYSGSGLGSPSRKYPTVVKADALMRKISRGGQGGVYR